MAITPAETSGEMALNEAGQQTVFVVELLDSPVFAFEAKSSSDAGEIVRSHWFTRSIDAFRSRRQKTEALDRRLRAATDVEASIFRDIACEFPEAAGNVLVAHLSGWKIEG